MFRLGILLPHWRREALARLVMQHLRSTTDTLRERGVTTIVVVAASPEDPSARVLAGEFPRFSFIWADNKPVSDKWQRGTSAMRSLRLDAMMHMNSDNLVTADYIKYGCNMVWDGGHDYVHANGLYFHDTRTHDTIFVGDARVGCCSFISRRLLERAGWRIWPSGINTGIDQNMPRRLAKWGLEEPGTIGVRPMEGSALFVDIKSYYYDEKHELRLANINGFEAVRHAFRKRSKVVDSLEFFTKYFPGSYDAIKSLY